MRGWRRLAVTGLIGIVAAIAAILYGAATGWFADWSNREPAPPGWQMGAGVAVWIALSALALCAVFGACRLVGWVWQADRR